MALDFESLKKICSDKIECGSSLILALATSTMKVMHGTPREVALEALGRGLPVRDACPPCLRLAAYSHTGCSLWLTLVAILNHMQLEDILEEALPHWALLQYQLGTA